MLNNKKRIYNISAKLQPFEVEILKIYIKGAVKAFCNNCDGCFSVKALFGKDNSDWNDTPLQLIYEYYIRQNKPREKAAKQAAVDVGRLLKKVLDEDQSSEYEELNNYTNEYLIVKN